MTLCVYAVVRARTLPRGVRGLRHEPLHLVRRGGIAAVVGELPRVPAPTIANLRRFDAIVRRLWTAHSALLPVRFGTCADSDELGFILRARHDALGAAVTHVRNRAQMTVRLVQPGPAESADGPAQPALPANPRRTARSGVEYLRQAQEAASRQARIVGFDPVRAAVQRWVRDERVTRRGRVATIYHLVPRGSVEAYRRTLERAAAETGIRVTVTGPWPPYAFG